MRDFCDLLDSLSLLGEVVKDTPCTKSKSSARNTLCLARSSKLHSMSSSVVPGECVQCIERSIMSSYSAEELKCDGRTAVTGHIDHFHIIQGRALVGFLVCVSIRWIGLPGDSSLWPLASPLAS
ncbi:hypothetical protein KIPB_007311 [Kipferlia bialata]|uniref:Uncharacterized protein n=1 Tax=Kipferlia bialata TaxID=797122 RepID=A0A9K3CZV7_9EUKA|nr:hypothetical protein KIPB_007311 [Kipferlia bialata]|eukprot:g7311.t1